MHPESDYGPMVGELFANASAASPPAVYFANSPPIIRLLPTRTNVMGLCLSKCHWSLNPGFMNLLQPGVQLNRGPWIVDRGYLISVSAVVNGQIIIQSALSPFPLEIDAVFIQTVNCKLVVP
jgi:hypothetical protein